MDLTPVFMTGPNCGVTVRAAWYSNAGPLTPVFMTGPNCGRTCPYRESSPPRLTPVFMTGPNCGGESFANASANAPF